jgi:F0F1-type ATP synthase assembly protein I
MAITAQKFLPQGKTGGDLAVTPKTSLIKSPKEGGNIVFTIQKKIILVDDLLKGTLAEKKERQKKEVKKKEDDQRAKQEADQEKPDTEEEEGNKLVMPRLSFLDGIKNFLSDVLVGWLTFRLIKFLPQIIKVLKILGPIADFLLFIGGKLLDGLVTLIDWGYKAVEGTRGFVKNIFGEKGAQAFDNIVGHLNTLFNVIGAIALGVLAVGNQSKKQKKDEVNKRTKNNKKLKERYNRRQKYKQQQKRIKRKKFFKKRTPKALRKTIQRGKITAKKFTRNLKKTPQKLTKNISKNLSKTTKSVSKNLTKTTQTVGKNVTKATKAVSKTTQAVGKNISKVSGKISQSAGKIVTRLGMKMNTGMVQSMKGLSKMAKGVRIPIVGPLLAALTSYLADGKWDKALFIGVGTALGEMLGTAIPIPVLGTLLGGAIGYYVGDLLYTLFRGGGAGAVLNKLKEDLKKVFNVGEAIFNWSKTGLGRLWEGLPKVFGVPNPAWLFNPLNMVGKVKLLGKAFFSRDPMVEEKDKEEKEKGDTPTSKEKELFKLEQRKLEIIDGTNWSSTKEMQNDPEYIAIEKEIADFHAGKYNVKGNAENIIPLDVNSVAKKTNNISTYDEEEETVVIKPGSETGGDVVPETETKESITPVVAGGGGGNREIDEALYKSG